MQVPEISVHAVHEQLQSAAPPRLIDVRELDEWQLCHIPGAELIPLSSWPSVALEKLGDPQQALVIHCHHGGRSQRAAAFLIENGFQNVRNLTGGIDAWSMEIDPRVARY